MIQINYRDTRPFYQQIKDNVRHLVVSGALKKDDKLPSVRELAASLAINPNTIQRAYRELENEGIYLYPARKGHLCGRNGPYQSDPPAGITTTI